MERRSNKYRAPCGTVFEIRGNCLYHPMKNLYSLPVTWEINNGVDIALINGQWVVDYSDNDWWVDKK